MSAAVSQYQQQRRYPARSDGGRRGAGASAPFRGRRQTSDPRFYALADESTVRPALGGQGPSVDQANRTMQANPTTRQYAANGRRVLVVNQRVRNRTDR
jgi:hypothetical protein